MTIARALSVAGSDSGGGAGIAADLRTFQALGVHGLVALTAVTAQDTVAVRSVHGVPASMVRAQIEAAVDDIGVDAAKTGMLGRAEVVEVVADALLPNLVVDPVLRATTGASLLDDDGLEMLRSRLLPSCLVVTPNADEAAAILGRPTDDPRDLLAFGPRWVLLTGGTSAVDLLTDGRDVLRLASEPIPTSNTHGTGCTLSAALTAGLAKGLSVPEAARAAKTFVTRAIRLAVPLGRGAGPVRQLPGS